MGRGQRSDSTPTPARLSAHADTLLPAEHGDYLAAIDTKHFAAATAAGSVFTSPNNLRDLLAVAQRQPGGLGRDDRALMAADGVPADAFLDACRYLRVPARGRMGLIDADALPDDERVVVVRHKPGAPCSLTVRRPFGDPVDYATVVIGPNDHERASTAEMVWTAHPGPPVRPSSADHWDQGSVITVAQVRRRLGPGPLWLQAAP
jgi:hypothetical protein